MALSAPAADAARRHHTHARAISFAGLTDPSKDAALVVDGETGKVLYARNEDALRHPASLTKMMTLYLLFDALKKGQMTLSTSMPVSAHAAAQKPTNLHLRAGEQITVEQAIKAIVVRSANDVAVTIAEALGGTESHFAELMNAKARAFGMRDTFYHNASGLPDPLQITTASDLAILARHLAYDFPQYFHYFSTPAFNFQGTEYLTHDNLIGRYQGADGIKTGYTGASGFNLVSSVVRGNVHIIGIVMGGRTAQRRDREMIHLLDDTFAQIDQQPTLVARAPVPWRSVAMNTTPSYSGLLANSGSVIALPTPRGPVSDADDEDAAESRPDLEDQPVAPEPEPAGKPAVVATYQPPRPAAPQVQTASIPKPAIRPGLGEGDVGDAGVVTPSLGLHDWTIQIGAYADLNLARTQLADYAEKSMDILGQAQRIVVPFQSSDGHMLYRARFGPFLEREARQICQRLTERGQTCFAAIATR
ncbi:MAG: D-alanyl-D-alanine carboxypeptidase [Alphaproteobacteria bacterium]|nr:D-alanyl-D-alanine carboxypeptidase [Alphaproteobacteria bacterium]